MNPKYLRVKIPLPLAKVIYNYWQKSCMGDIPDDELNDFLTGKRIVFSSNALLTVL